MKAQYQTRQRSELLDFLKEYTGVHFAAAEIQKRLKDTGTSIGRARESFIGTSSFYDGSKTHYILWTMR